MKTRNPFVVLILSIITFGIYDLYWLIKTKEVLNKETRVHTPSILLLFVPVALMIALSIILIIVSPSTTTNMNNTLQTPSNTAATTSSAGLGVLAIILVLEFISVLVIIPITFYWLFKFSKAVSEYTHGEMSTGITFILLWLLHFIGVAIVQDKFNDVNAHVSAPGSTPVTASVGGAPQPGPIPEPTADGLGQITPTSPAPAPSVSAYPPAPTNPPDPTPPVQPPSDQPPTPPAAGPNDINSTL